MSYLHNTSHMLQYRPGARNATRKPAALPSIGMNNRVRHTVDNHNCGTAYAFRVSGMGCGSPYSTDYGETAEVTSSIPCPAPTPANVIATPVAQDMIKVSWDTQEGVTAYRVQYAPVVPAGTPAPTWTTASDNVAPTHVVPTPGATARTSFTLDSRVCGTTYRFKVSGKGDGMAYNGITYSSFSFGEASNPSDTSAAAATDFFCTPQNLNVTPLVQRKARLTWEAVANATRYEVDAYRVGEIGGWQPLPRSGAGLGMPNDEAIPAHEFKLDRIIGAWGLDDNDAFKFHVRAVVPGHATDMIFSEEITLVDSPIISVNGDSAGRGPNDGKMVVKWAWDADYAQNTYTIRYRKLPDNHHQIPTMGMAGWQPDSAANDMVWATPPPNVQPTPTRGVSLENPITGLEQYKVYAVQLNYTTPTNTYFSAREAYVWPSNRAAGNGERVATFPLNHPLSELIDETYRYRICLSTFSSDMNKQDAWKTFIEHALDQWELATNGLVTMIYTPGSCADYSEILNDVHEK